MKKWVRISSISAAVLLGTATVATAGYFLGKAILGNKDRLGKPMYSSSDARYERVNGTDGFIVQYPYEGRKGDNPADYFLTKDELQDLQSEIFTKLYYGPEIFELKHIIVNNWTLAPPETLGFYIPDTHELYIDIQSIRFSDLTPEQRIEYIVSVVAHEYGHHLTTSYFQNIRSYNGTQNTYSQTGNKEAWNPGFLTAFDTINDFNNNDKLSFNVPRSFNIQSLNNNLSLSQIYNFSNYTKHTDVDIKSLLQGLNLSKKYGYISNSPFTYPLQQPLPYDLEDKFAGGTASLSYIYSIAEQLTRKLEELMYPIDFDIQKIVMDKDKISPYSFVYGNKDTSKALYHNEWADIFKTYSVFQNGTSLERSSFLTYPDAIFGGIYGSTPDADPTAQPVYSPNRYNVPDAHSSLYADYLSGMGFGKQISHMWFKNVATITGLTSKGFYTVANDQKSDNNEIKFSGYSDKDFTKIIVDHDTNKAIDITSSKIDNKGDGLFRFNGKNKLLDHFQDLHPWDLSAYSADKDYYSYVTTNFVNPSKFLSGKHELEFWNGQDVSNPNNFEKITTVNTFGQVDNTKPVKPSIPDAPSTFVTSYNQGTLYSNTDSQKNDFWNVGVVNNILYWFTSQ